MGREGRYSKRMQFHRETANAFVSCRRFMNGADGTTDDLKERFLHDAVNQTFSSCPLLADLRKNFSGNRKNGCVAIEVPISKNDWYDLQDFLELLQKIDEGDLIQFCLNYRLEDLKKKGIE